MTHEATFDLEKTKCFHLITLKVRIELCGFINGDAQEKNIWMTNRGLIRFKNDLLYFFYCLYLRINNM